MSRVFYGTMFFCALHRQLSVNNQKGSLAGTNEKKNDGMGYENVALEQGHLMVIEWSQKE